MQQNLILNGHTILANSDRSIPTPGQIGSMLFAGSMPLGATGGITSYGVPSNIITQGHTQFIGGVPVLDHPCKGNGGSGCGCGGSCIIKNYIPADIVNSTDQVNSSRSIPSLSDTALNIASGTSVNNPRCPTDIPPLFGQPGWTEWMPRPYANGSPGSPDPQLFIPFSIGNCNL
jgi:hypothetical protein